MLTLTLLTNKNGSILFKTDNNHMRVIGEFLIRDALAMPDFIRALLTTDDEETITMDACVIETKDTFFIIKHLHLKNLPILSLSKERMLQVLDIWEDFLVQKNPTQWIFFKEEESGVTAQEEISKKWDQIEEKISHILHKKNKQKESE